jgi:hypothetical protein
MADLGEMCAKRGRKPCIHMETAMLTKSKIDALNHKEWYYEMEELILNVERGKRDSP